MKSYKVFDWVLSNSEDNSCVENGYFTDLTPVDDADEDGCYRKALSFALDNKRVNNIALTGPYGSGKSSVIRTFEKTSKYNFLNISLASFRDENLTKLDSKIIERSILQQMLYGADANKLPYSRFKRIQTPTKSKIKSSLLIFWLLIITLLYHHRSELLAFTPYSTQWVFVIFFISYSFALPILLISDAYKASFGISLKKLSLKNAEIEVDSVSNDSVLNRHLDEIIYFFQSTRYDVVVIEDLDRFEDPEVFVKLREINKIVNDNEKTKRQVKFLYALKDDMFVHKSRAKFFDFIIPVIPVISSTNALDKIQERLGSYSFKDNVDMQFLREVSLYVNDYRVIHNIFNELAIYYDRLKSENLDVTTLLAIMIYKNCYPRDFEGLHYGKGALFEICASKIKYQSAYRQKLELELEHYRALQKGADNESFQKVQDLVVLYVGHIAMCADKAVYGVYCDDEHVSFEELSNIEVFEKLMLEGNIQLVTHPANNSSYRINTGKTFEQLEEEINPGETFASRKENIKNKTRNKKKKLFDEADKIKKRILEVSQLQLYQVLQNAKVDLEDVYEKNDIKEDWSLLEYLVKNGYLSDNYHLYTSCFYEGRLTKNDRDYILTIRNFSQPDPTQIIDTPKEVCENIRAEDFNSIYVLNVILIDYLLEDKGLHREKLRSALSFISKNYGDSLDFMKSYFESGKNIDLFVISLSKEWPEYALAIESSDNEIEQISYVLACVESGYLVEDMNYNGLLGDYLTNNAKDIFTSNYPKPIDYSFLVDMAISFNHLAQLEANASVVELAVQKSLYDINIHNINYILNTFSENIKNDGMEVHKSNYSAIRDSGIESLKSNIEDNICVYVDKVLLALPDNVLENESSILYLLNHSELSNDLKEKIIQKQENIFETFDNIPSQLWNDVLVREKIKVTWNNVAEYLCNEGLEQEVAAEYLSIPGVIAKLIMQSISKDELGELKCKRLCEFIINNDGMDEGNYRKLVSDLPYWYHDFPDEISYEKMSILASEGSVKLTEKSFNSAYEENQILAFLIMNRFQEFLENKGIYKVNDSVRGILLSSEMNVENKISVCLDVTLPGIQSSKKLLNTFIQILVNNQIDCSKFDVDILTAAIVDADEIDCSIRLLTKCLSLWSEEKVMQVLSSLKWPYRMISSYGSRPKVVKNSINQDLAERLIEKGYVSSIKEIGDFIRINTFKSQVH